MKKIVLTLVFFWIFISLYAQSYVPGQSYFDSMAFVEYKAGNLSIIISAPHGGDLQPAFIPDRSCTGCSLIKDSWTKQISEGLYNSIYKQTGCYPHLIINLLHRKKFDANRDIADAADGNASVEQAWYAYHRFIDSAKINIKDRNERGFFIDIHGHAHSIQRIELGYLLSKAELQLSDSLLNSFPYFQESSIRSLVKDNINGAPHSMLLRGGNSLGTLLYNKGFASVPSYSDPYPNSPEPYFTGGFNTHRHGSRDNQDKIDAIQIELNQSIRFNDTMRVLLIDSLAKSVLEYYAFNYDSLFFNSLCNTVGLTENNPESIVISLYPNPAKDYFEIQSDLAQLHIHIYNNQGKLLLNKTVVNSEKINTSEFAKGLYFVKIFANDSLFYMKKLLLNSK